MIADDDYLKAIRQAAAVAETEPTPADITNIAMERLLNDPLFYARIEIAFRVFEDHLRAHNKSGQGLTKLAMAIALIIGEGQVLQP